MSWLTRIARRFKQEDKVRYFTEGRRGKGKGIVLSPNFAKGTVMDFDSSSRRYKVKDTQTNEVVDVHPRNLVYDSVKSPESANIPAPTAPSVMPPPSISPGVSPSMPF